MKILFIAILFSTICVGQFTNEHSYFGQSVSRIILENSGEKYYFVDRMNQKIQFFNANHSLWKTINLTLPTDTWSIYVNHISENKINTDNLIEISYTTYSSPNIYQSKIINELGTVLLSVDNCSSLSLNEQAGSPSKIISSSYSNSIAESNIYSVPDILLEHTYTGSETKRIKLENSGVKYYNFNTLNGVVTIYNSDYSFWKSITLNKPIGYSFSGIKFLTENQINTDNLIEIGYSYYLNGADPAQQQSEIINENGATLLTVNNAVGLQISALDGLPNKLIANLYTPSTQSYETKIYNCPNLILEHTYSGTIDRVKLDLSGEKYYDRKNNYNPAIAIEAEAIIYNSDHTIWKTIIIPVNEFFMGTISNIYASETKFDADSQVELSYTLGSNTLDGGHFQSYIINEDSSMFFTVPESSSFYLSEIPTLSTKLIIYFHHNYGFLNIETETIVCSLGGVFGVNNFNNNQVTIFPNPANDYLNFKSQFNSISKAVIYDLQGKTIEEFEGENIEVIAINKIATGAYIIKLIDNNDIYSTYKFLKTSN